jgi:hypothetical protein
VSPGAAGVEFAMVDPGDELALGWRTAGSMMATSNATATETPTAALEKTGGFGHDFRIERMPQGFKDRVLKLQIERGRAPDGISGRLWLYFAFIAQFAGGE